MRISLPLDKVTENVISDQKTLIALYKNKPEYGFIPYQPNSEKVLDDDDLNGSINSINEHLESEISCTDMTNHFFAASLSELAHLAQDGIEVGVTAITSAIEQYEAEDSGMAITKVTLGNNNDILVDLITI